MKFVRTIAFLSALVTDAQGKIQNVFIIRFDGFRWQEMFGGAGGVLIRNVKFVEDALH